MKSFIFFGLLAIMVISTCEAGDPTLRINENAYGLGVHSDQYGRVIEYKPVTPPGAPKLMPDPLLRVDPNVYGPGIGRDQYGRPVEAVPKY
jgi:hypothetical protein